MIIGDKFVRVLSFVKYPDLFIEGLLAPLVTQTAFDMDIVVESTDLDLASAIKNKWNIQMIFTKNQRILKNKLG